MFCLFQVASCMCLMESRDVSHRVAYTCVESTRKFTKTFVETLTGNLYVRFVVCKIQNGIYMHILISASRPKISGIALSDMLGLIELATKELDLHIMTFMMNVIIL